MRDWRRKEVIRIDPETVDLMWELHADLGSTAPDHNHLRLPLAQDQCLPEAIGRNVARKSQHMVGKAIDLYFPDISTEKMRNSALVRQVGGVGYYRSSGGPRASSISIRARSAIGAAQRSVPRRWPRSSATTARRSARA